MQVFVLDTGRKPLDPCSPARARILLAKGRAAVFRRYPFTKSPSGGCPRLQAWGGAAWRRCRKSTTSCTHKPFRVILGTREQRLPRHSRLFDISWSSPVVPPIRGACKTTSVADPS